MIKLKQQAEQLYLELFGHIAVPKPDYITQIIQLMAIIQAQEVKRGRKATDQNGA